MLKDNYKAFILTEIFAIFSFLLTMMVFFCILFLITLLFPDFTVRDLGTLIRTRFGISVAFRLVVFLIVGVVLMGFMNCQYGLSNDIINSGEMFAQFKGSFTYFKKNWWQFLVLTTFLTAFSSIMPLNLMDSTDRPPESLTLTFYNYIFLALRLLLYFFWHTLLIHAFPSVVYKNRLFTALKESFTIFHRDFKKIVKIWGIFFLIFYIPSILVALFGILLHSETNAAPNVPIFALIILLIFLLIGFPFSTLLATGIYNNSSVIRDPAALVHEKVKTQNENGKVPRKYSQKQETEESNQR